MGLSINDVSTFWGREQERILHHMHQYKKPENGGGGVSQNLFNIEFTPLMDTL